MFSNMLGSSTWNIHFLADRASVISTWNTSYQLVKITFCSTNIVRETTSQHPEMKSRQLLYKRETTAQHLEMNISWKICLL